MTIINYVWNGNDFYFFLDLEEAKAKRKEINSKHPVVQKNIYDYCGSLYLMRKAGGHCVYGNYWKAKDRAFPNGTVKKYKIQDYDEWLKTALYE